MQCAVSEYENERKRLKQSIQPFVHLSHTTVLMCRCHWPHCRSRPAPIRQTPSGRVAARGERRSTCSSTCSARTLLASSDYQTPFPSCAASGCATAPTASVARSRLLHREAHARGVQSPSARGSLTQAKTTRTRSRVRMRRAAARHEADADAGLRNDLVSPALSASPTWHARAR